jgi:SPP1 gp7 family putative phage head morphogenesis protein
MAEPTLAELRGHRPETNEMLRNLTTRRFFYLEAYKNYIVQQHLGRFNIELYPEVEARIEVGLNRIKMRNMTVTERNDKELRRLFRQIDTIVRDAFRAMEVRLARDLNRLTVDEQQHERSMLMAALPVGALALALPGTRKTEQAVTERPMYGQTRAQWTKELADKQIQETQQQVRIGVSRGEEPEEIVRRVRGTAAGRYEDGVHGRSRRHLQGVLASSVAHAAYQTRQVMREENIEIVPREQWTCVLDAATCLECMSWHGTVFGVNEGPSPPLHIRCRCIRIPLGLGDPASAQLFDDWLADQPEEVVVEALGVRRARLFLRGGMQVGDFTNSVGRTYTLKQLRAKEPWAFRAAGL